jgi:hypothetical protein
MFRSDISRISTENASSTGEEKPQIRAGGKDCSSALNIAVQALSFALLHSHQSTTDESRELASAVLYKAERTNQEVLTLLFRAKHCSAGGDANCCTIVGVTALALLRRVKEQ